jgi:hypothetical protein
MAGMCDVIDFAFVDADAGEVEDDLIHCAFSVVVAFSAGIDDAVGRISIGLKDLQEIFLENLTGLLSDGRSSNDDFSSPFFLL